MEGVSAIACHDEDGPQAIVDGQFTIKNTAEPPKPLEIFAFASADPANMPGMLHVSCMPGDMLYI